jgi:hypothetical protein
VQVPPPGQAMQLAGLLHVLGTHTYGVPPEVLQQPDQQSALAVHAHCQALPTLTHALAPQLMPQTPQCCDVLVCTGIPPQQRLRSPAA